MGRVSERWRYDVTEYVEARKRALEELDAVKESRLFLGALGAPPSRLNRPRRPCVDPRGGGEPTERALRGGFFDQVPASVTGAQDDWQTVLWDRWARDDGILTGRRETLDICRSAFSPFVAQPQEASCFIS